MAREQPTSACEALAPRTLWLDIRFADERWTFELGPDEDRAIVVGSLLRARVRIDRRGIAPVRFHFERKRDAVRLIPAYRAGPVRQRRCRRRPASDQPARCDRLFAVLGASRYRRATKTRGSCARCARWSFGAGSRDARIQPDFVTK